MPPRKVNWVVWGGAACGCVFLAALLFVGVTFYFSGKILAKSTAHHLLHPAPAPPALEAGVSVVSATGHPLDRPRAGANYRYTVKLSSTANSALLVQQVRVAFLDATGHEVGSIILKNSVVVPGAPQAFSGEVELRPEAIGKVTEVKASVISTPLAP